MIYKLSYIKKFGVGDINNSIIPTSLLVSASLAPEGLHWDGVLSRFSVCVYRKLGINMEILQAV